MTELIECEFWNTKYNIGVTKLGHHFALIDGKVKEVIKESHCGSIHYRIKGTGTRASRVQLNKEEFIVKNKVIQLYCPF